MRIEVKASVPVPITLCCRVFRAGSVYLGCGPATAHIHATPFDRTVNLGLLWCQQHCGMMYHPFAQLTVLCYAALPVDASEAPPAATGVGPSSPPFKRMHSRSRSNAAAIDLLAIASSPLSPCGSGLPLVERSRSASAGGQQPASSVALAAAATTASGNSSPGSKNLLSKQQQQLLLSASGAQSPAGAASGAATAASAGPDSAAALLPGLQLGPPGTNLSPFASSAGAAGGGANSTSGARKLAHQSSSSKKRSSGANSLAGGAAAGGFFLSSDGSSSPAGAAAGGGMVASCTPCLSGCCAPSYAVGLLIALLYKGRFPEEYEAQWAGCPRLKVGSGTRPTCVTHFTAFVCWLCTAPAVPQLRSCCAADSKLCWPLGALLYSACICCALLSCHALC